MARKWLQIGFDLLYINKFTKQNTPQDVKYMPQKNAAHKTMWTTMFVFCRGKIYTKVQKYMERQCQKSICIYKSAYTRKFIRKPKGCSWWLAMWLPSSILIRVEAVSQFSVQSCFSTMPLFYIHRHNKKIRFLQLF